MTEFRRLRAALRRRRQPEPAADDLFAIALLLGAVEAMADALALLEPYPQREQLRAARQDADDVAVAAAMAKLLPREHRSGASA